MSRQWVSVNLLSGEILAYFADIEAQGPLRRSICGYDTASVTLHITDSIDPGWERAVLEGATALVAFDGDPGNERIEWGGIVLQAPRDLTSAVQLSLATPEAYLDRCYVGDYRTSPARDQNLIATDLVEQFAAGAGQIPFAIDVVGDPGVARIRHWLDSGNSTVYSILTNLASVDGGVEWCMTWQWTHNPEMIVPLFQVGTRLGSAAAPGLSPNVVFETPMIQTGAVGHDYSSGVGANKVTCYSGASKGGSQSAVARDLMGRPLWEYRYTPSTSITDPATLLEHAQSAVARMNPGGQPVTIVAPRDTVGLQLGVDWNLGDDVGYRLSSPAFPTPYEGIARCVAYETTPTTVTPILASIP